MPSRDNSMWRYSLLSLTPRVSRSQVSNLSQRFGFERATSVQRATIPAVLSGSDVMVKSQTGSGTW